MAHLNRETNVLFHQVTRFLCILVCNRLDDHFVLWGRKHVLLEVILNVVVTEKEDIETRSPEDVLAILLQISVFTDSGNRSVQVFVYG